MKIIYSISLFALAIFSQAQTKQFTMAEAVLGLGTNLRVDNISQLKWLPNTNAFTSQSSDGNYLLRTIVPTLKVDTLAKINDFASINLKRIPNLLWKDADNSVFNVDNQYYKFTNHKFTNWFTLPEKAEVLEFSDQLDQYTYVIDNNLFAVDLKGNTQQITKDGSYEIVNGKSVHREEFGIDKGIFYAPKGNFVAFYRMDQSNVEDYPIIDWTTVPAVNHNIKYPFAGRKSHEVTLGIHNLNTNQTIFVKTDGPKDQYLTSVTWSPDENFVFIGLLNRDQNHLSLNKYDAKTGQLVKTLFEEKSDKYVQPLHPLTFIEGTKNEFIWWSQRDGFQHLYRYNSEGKLINQITKGDWLVNEILGFNSKEKEVLIATSKDSPMEKHLYKVNWESGKLTKLDTDAAYHNLSANSNGNYVLDNWSNAKTPRAIDVIATSGKWKKNLLSAKDPLADYQRPKIEEITLKASDGTPLYGKMIYPVNFDANKKYPVIVYLYNGPNVQLLSHKFPESGNLWYEYMAQHGYVVFTMDGRGSSNRGLKFEQATFRQLGTVEMEDQMQGIKYLQNLPFVNKDKMGIHGWSFGGFMTTSFMLKHPDVFKAGVAGGPVMDWSMYEVMYTERYMDTPETNPQGYENAKLLDKTQNLKGKLLLIHGTQDNVVVWQHSIDFIRNAVSNGVQVDYFVYPGYEHNVGGKDRIHLMQKVTDYFDLYLK